MDATEDVDLYSFKLNAGDTVAINTNANQFDSELDSVLRLFDSEGTELELSDDTPAPKELFVSALDSYIEYTAEEAGTYYVGVSSFENFEYDPSTAGSGTGQSRGEYDLSINLVSGDGGGNGGDGGANGNSNGDGGGTGSGGPTVSLQTISGTFNQDESDNILADNLVKSVDDNGASLLTFVLNTEGPVPEDGLEVTVNSDIALTDYFGGLNNPPFSPGGEVLEAVYDPETGEATGFRFRIDEPNAIVNLAVQNLDEPEDDGPEQASFFLEDGEGYTINENASDATVTFYDTLEQVPDPTSEPEVGFTVSKNNLVESQGTETTLTFNLSEPPPSDGVLVYVNSGVEGAVSEFDVLNAEIEGGVFPTPNFSSSGFFFKILEPTASITLPVFSDNVTEGREGFTFSLQEGPGYTVAPQASEATLTIADTPDSQLQVGVEVEPTTLIESNGTEATLTFNLSASPPEQGIAVTLNSDVPGFAEEFNADSLELTGGTIDAINDDSLVFTLAEPTATITAPVLNDGEAEGLEELTFSLAPGAGYIVNPDASEVNLTLVDRPGQVPPPTFESEPNDTIPQALDTRLNPNNRTFSISGAIAYHDNEEVDASEDDDNIQQVDASEDVNFYKFNLKAGDTVTVDIDASQFSSELDSELRLFDYQGTELLIVNNAPAPDEFFVANRDPYLDFTAEEAGTYIVGVSQLGNRTYDPFTAGSGSGRIFPDSGINTGEYDLEIGLILRGSEA